VQNIVIAKPYRFVPPYDSRFWPAVFAPYLPRYLRRSHGIAALEYRGLEHLKQSLAAGHGIVLAPNHCRLCDPMVLAALAGEVRRPFFFMSSWHLFMQGRVQRWLLRRLGAFSVHREGLDKAALGAAIDILERAERPLVLFPEGIVSRTNDRLSPLQEGVTFVARSAARKRAKKSAQARVVVHPVALNYFFRGDLKASLQPVLEEIERRLSWAPQSRLPLIERITKVGNALLGLKEVEYLGQVQTGDIGERLLRLLDQLLVPLEKEWLGGRREPNVVARVKRLRAAILPDLASGEVSDEERDRRWRQLADLYLAQQLYFYPPDYVRSRPTPERMLETVERFEEDLTDRARVHRPLTALAEVGEALEVSPEHDRGSPADPLLQKLEEQLKGMLERNAHERTAPLPSPEAV
jgi:1-acyl-sn-glycerol-3-phosphate acyltransferase